MSPLRGPEVAQGGASGGSQTGIEQRPYEPSRGGSEATVPTNGAIESAYRVWNAAAFPGLTDAAKLKEAIAECKLQGKGVVWTGGKPAGWSVSETTVVAPGIRVSGTTLGLATKLEATGNFFIFTLGEAADSSEITLEFMFFRAKTAQASGGAIGWAANGTIFHIHDLRFGSNLKFGINASGFLISAAWFEKLAWNDGATQAKSCGTAIKLGDGTTLVNQIRFHDCEVIAATTADMEVGLELNFVDTVSVCDCIFEVMKVGIQMGVVEGGSTTTGVKFTNVVVDTTSGHGWNLGKYRDVELVNCNAQTCGVKLVGVGINLRSGKGFRMKGGCIQHNENHGFVAEAGAEHFYLDGVDIADNNMANEGGSGVAIAAGVSKWHMRNCTSGNFYGLGGKQQFGILVEAGASTEFHVTDNTWTGNTVGAVENLATGTSQTWKRNITTGVARAYGAKTERATGAAIVASTSTDMLVQLTIETQAAVNTSVEIIVGGVQIAVLNTGVDVSANQFSTPSFQVPATFKWEVKVAAGKVEKLFSSYLPL